MRLVLLLLILGETCFGQVLPSARRISTPRFRPDSTLNNNLVAYWKFDETSGNRADSEPTGTAQTMTDENTVLSVPGVIGEAAYFNKASEERLTRTDSADLSMGDIDFTWTIWVAPDTQDGNSQTIFAKWNTGTSEYILRLTSGTTFQWFVSNDGTTVANVASSFTPVNPGTWYFVACGHNSVNNTIWISVNGGALETTSHSTGVFDGTATFHFGVRADISSIYYYNGSLDEPALWKRTLTTGEIAELYAEGDGKTCCPFTPP